MTISVSFFEVKFDWDDFFELLDGVFEELDVLLVIFACSFASDRRDFGETLQSHILKIRHVQKTVDQKSANVRLNLKK